MRMGWLDESSVINFFGRRKMRVTDFLDEAGVKYEVTEHVPAFTAQQMAAAEHEPGRYVAKPVIIRADGTTATSCDSATSGSARLP